MGRTKLPQDFEGVAARLKVEFGVEQQKVPLRMQDYLDRLDEAERRQQGRAGLLHVNPKK